MAAACAKRISTDMLMDAARKAVNSVTGCDDCYFVLPSIKDVLPSPNFSGHLLAVSAAGTSCKNKEDLTGQDTKYYTVESDQHAPVQVILQLSDLEMAAMQTMRSLSVGAGTTASQEEVRIQISQRSQLSEGSGHSSSSWAIRRFFSRTPTRHGFDHTDTTDSNADAVCESGRDTMDDYHATAIPFTLLDGQQAVVVCVKNGVALPGWIMTVWHGCPKCSHTVWKCG